MTYRYSRSKIPSYSKMSLPKLKDIEADILKKNPDLKNHSNLYHEEEKKLVKLREEKNGFLNKIAEIRNMALARKQREYAAAGAIKKFFMDNTAPSFTEPEKAEIARLRTDMGGKFSYGYDSNKYRLAHDILSRIQTLISQKEKIDVKNKTDRAIIAAYKNKSRQLAGQIKSALREQMNIDPHCPYCGKDMGDDDPHCDHIYPVSKGGLSTPQNMVYICSDCNLKKTDLTLTQFIKKYVSQRLKVEQRLEKLGKDY